MKTLRLVFGAALMASALLIAAPAAATTIRGSATPGGDIERIDVAYDDTGQVTASVTFTPVATDQMLGVAFARCDDTDGSDALNLEFFGTVAGTNAPGLRPVVTVSPDGRTVTAVVRSPSLAGAGLDCVSTFAGTIRMTLPPPPPVGPIVFDQAGVTAAARVQLAARYETQFTTAHDVWVSCPSAMIAAARRLAGCVYEFRNGRDDWTAGSVMIEGDTATLKDSTFHRAARRCPGLRDIRSGNKLMINRTLRVNGQGCAGMVARSGFVTSTDWYTLKRYPRTRIAPTWTFDPGLRMFPEINRFRCTTKAKRSARYDMTAYTIRCANARGDGWVYAFQIGRSGA